MVLSLKISKKLNLMSNYGGLVNKDIFVALLDVVIENENITEEEKDYIKRIKTSM